MEPATPSSVMGDSEALHRAEGTEEDAGIYIPPDQVRRAVEGYAPGVVAELSYQRSDISAMLVASLLPTPPGYTLQPKNRHERRRNRAILRDGIRLPVATARFSFSE